MANVTTSFSSLASMQAAVDFVNSSGLTIGNSMIYAQAAYDYADYYPFSSFSVQNSTNVAGTLINGDSLVVYGSNLLSYPSTYTRIDYTFNPYGITTSLYGSVYESSYYADKTGYINKVVVSQGSSKSTIIGYDDVSLYYDGTISSFKIESGNTSFSYAGNLSAYVWVDSYYQYQAHISGNITSVTISSGNYTATLSGVSLDFNTLNTLNTVDEVLSYALNGNDNVAGTNAAEFLFGYAGNDSLTGLNGSDTLDGGSGSDTLKGGSGGDYYYVDNTADQVIETDNSDDTTSRDLTLFDGPIAERLEKFYIAYYGRAADYDGLAYWKTTLTTVLNNEQIKMCGYFGNPLQTEFKNLYGTGNTNDVFLTNVYLNLFNRAPDPDGLNYWKGVITQLQSQGKTLDDARATVVIFVLDGATGADATLIATKTENAVALSKVIARYDDDSNAYGNANNTTIFANARDWLKDLGSADFGNGSWEAFYLFTANDILGINTGDIVESSVNWTLGNYVEHLVLTGSNPISGTGNALNNALFGNAASNILTGGAGRDSFVFETALGPNNIDTLTDFNPAQDTLALSQDIFTTLPLGMLNANAFYIGTAAHDLDDRIVFNSANGNLSYDPDGTGAQAAQVFAVLPVGIALTNVNIEVV